jgi:hypothetical protein
MADSLADVAINFLFIFHSRADASGATIVLLGLMLAAAPVGMYVCNG